MRNRWFVTSAALLVMAAFGIAQVSFLKLEARLTGLGNDKGKAKWKQKGTPTQSQAEFEVEGENLIPNETYTIQVDGNVPWSVQADALGAFAFEQTYRGANRPTIVNGSLVTVTDSAGMTILTGTLRGR